MPGFADLRRCAIAALFAVLVVAGPSAMAAQVDTIDPNAAIDGDLYLPPPAPAPAAELPARTDTPEPIVYNTVDVPYDARPGLSGGSTTVAAPVAPATPVVPGAGGTFQEDDLVGAAEGVFGKGAQGLAEMIRDVLKKQGEPNAYIVGREGGGAFIFGARYGSGTLYHKVEGQLPVYWRGPSLGADVGANAGNTFVLVYNLFDTQDLFKTYGAGEGQAYLIGGFNVSYLKRKDVVLVPVRMGAGLRLGLNVGYMKFSQKQKWFPF
jgi:hypothetical protein